jgi:hypothetical protein
LNGSSVFTRLQSALAFLGHRRFRPNVPTHTGIWDNPGRRFGGAHRDGGTHLLPAAAQGRLDEIAMLGFASGLARHGALVVALPLMDFPIREYCHEAENLRREMFRPRLVSEMTADNMVGIVTSQLSAFAMIPHGSIPQNVNFAIGCSIITNFLSAKGIDPQLTNSDAKGMQELKPPDVADKAKEFTVQIYCKGVSRTSSNGVGVSASSVWSMH